MSIARLMQMGAAFPKGPILPPGAPTSGTQVFGPVIYSGNNAASRSISGAGFAPDFGLFMCRTATTFGIAQGFYDRPRGQPIIVTDSTETEAYWGGTAVNMGSFTSGGVVLPSNSSLWNVSGRNYVIEFFKEAPAFFDIVLYSGNGVTNRKISHNLQYIPEMIIVKGRNVVSNWAVYHKDFASSNSAMYLNLSNAESTSSGSVFGGDPTDVDFTVSGSGADVTTNDASKAYVAYLFATVPGVSFVGSYTGNGSSKSIDCGFSSSARFILIKRTNSTGDWYVWDSARGIVASNDPYSVLNNNSVEVTTNDSVDAISNGFTVNQNATTNLNLSGSSYICYAVA